MCIFGQDRLFILSGGSSNGRPFSAGTGEKVSFDLLDQPRQIGLVKGNTGRRDAVAFDVWRCMSMVRESTIQRWVIGMWLRIAPVQPFSSLIYRVAVAPDDATSEIQILPCRQCDISLKLDGSNDLCKGGAVSDDHQRRTPDTRISIRQAVDQQLIFRQRRQHQARTSSGLGFKWMAGSSVVCLSSETNEWLRASNSASRSICIS